MTSEEMAQLEDDGIPQGQAMQGAPPPMPVQQAPSQPLIPPDQPPASPAPIAPMPVPTKNVTDKESTYSSSRIKIDPREQAAQDQLQTTNKEQQANLAQGEKVTEAQNTAHQVQNVQKQRILEQHGERLGSLAKEAEKTLADRQAEYDKNRAALAASPPTSLFAGDRGGYRKFWAGVAMALGGLSERDTGHNTGYDMIMGAVDRHAKAEEARISHIKDVIGESKDAMNIALGRKHEAMADLSAWKAAALETAAAEMETRLGSLADPETKAKAQEKILALRQEAEKEKAQYLQATRTEIKNQVVKKTQDIVGGPQAGSGRPNPKQIELAMMGTSITDTMAQLKTLPIPDRKELKKVALNDKWIAAHTGMVGAGLDMAGVTPMSRFRGVSQKTADWVQAQELGADKVSEVLGSDEHARKNFVQNLKWGVDDTAETLRKKNENIQHFGAKAVNLAQQYGGMAETGSPGVIRTDGRPGAQTAPSAAPSAKPAAAQGRKVQLPDGRIGTLYPDGTFEEAAGAAPDKKAATASRLLAIRGGH